MSGVSLLPWAVHIADGVLSPFWLGAGWVLALILALLGVLQLGVRAFLAGARDRHEAVAHIADEVARVALMTAAFFVASSIHLKLGPTSVHLLLGGLVGVILGCRAGLAILLGVTLQAVLIPHGGVLTIGVNTCTEALPALLVGALFTLMQRASWHHLAVFRAFLVGTSAIVWCASAVFAVVVLATNPLGEVVSLRDQAGLVLQVSEIGREPAKRVLFHPATLVCLALFGAGCAWLERRMANPPEFALGLVAGGLAVLLTVSLTGLVLLAHGDQWRTFANVVFLAHLPLVLLEGLVVGSVVSFLARVKPEMIGLKGKLLPQEPARPPLEDVPRRPEGITTTSPVAVKPPLILLVLGALLLWARPVSAHALEADYTVDVGRQQVVVESWFETGDIPKSATVRVTREDGSVVAEGPLDAKGTFSFAYQKPETLRVVVSAPGGHRATLTIARQKLEGGKEEPGGSTTGATPKEEAAAPQEPGRGESTTAGRGPRWRVLAVATGSLVALAVLALGVRTVARGRGGREEAA